tara:strand:- start:461 stop:1123 length:663 start_codon:yes stop_codon:yes gene_type:complete
MIDKQTVKKNTLIKATKIPLIFLLVIWIVKLIEIYFEISFVEYGVLPRKISGLKGIIFSPFLHKDLKHLINNSIPILILGISLFYFFKRSKTIFTLLFFFSGVLLWCLGRLNFHIGASGIIYALASFIFFSGVLSKNRNISALSLIVIFIYGSLFWGLFPTHQEISWEGHLSGFFSGLILSWFFRNDLPKRKKYQWEIDEEAELKEKENNINFSYEYKEK